MDVVDRNRLIDEYYRAVDDEEYGAFDRIFQTDAHHVRPGQGVLEGSKAVHSFYQNERDTTNTNHSVRRRLHDDGGTLCVVEVSGVTPSGQFSRHVVGEFTFEDGRIASYQVYRGHPDGVEIIPR